jgi:hypothetical protein
VYSNKHKTPPEATIFLVNTQKLFNEVLFSLAEKQLKGEC